MSFNGWRLQTSRRDASLFFVSLLSSPHSQSVLTCLFLGHDTSATERTSTVCHSPVVDNIPGTNENMLRVPIYNRNSLNLSTVYATDVAR